MGKQPWSGKATLDGARWRGSFDNALALLAGELRPHMANDLEVGRNVLQDLGHILAEVAQLPPSFQCCERMSRVGTQDAYAEALVRSDRSVLPFSQ